MQIFHIGDYTLAIFLTTYSFGRIELRVIFFLTFCIDKFPIMDIMFNMDFPLCKDRVMGGIKMSLIFFITSLSGSFLWGNTFLEGDYILKQGRSSSSLISVDFIKNSKDNINAFYLQIVNGNYPDAVWINGKKIGEFKQTPALDCTPHIKNGTNHIVLNNTEKKEIEFVLWGSRNYWFLGSTHCHSIYSDGVHTVSWDLNEVNNLGGSFLAITDHNTLQQCNDTTWHQTGNVIPIRGTEWTTDSGHACILGVEGDNPVSYPVPILQMVDEATYRGGLIAINHPTRPGVAWQHLPFLDIGIDAIEVLNKPWSDYNQQAIDWWDTLLVQGKTITGIANSDFHNDQYQNILDPCIRVYAPSNDPDTILKYIKLGRVTMSEYYDHPQVYLYADSDNNGVYDRVMGDIIYVTAPTTVKFRIESINNVSGYKAQLRNKYGIFEEHANISNSWVYEWTHTYNSGDTDFVRVEIRNAENLGRGFTNPIYINHQPYEMGPVSLSIHTTILPESILWGEIDTVYLQLKNNGPLTPYGYGVHFSVDTSEFQIVNYKTSGSGIGSHQSGSNWDGFQWVEWYGGYLWSNHFSPGDSINLWVAIEPKNTGLFLVYYRAWATDRLFIVNRDPGENQGITGAGGYRCWVDTISGFIGIFNEPGAGLRQVSVKIENPVRKNIKVYFSQSIKKPIEIIIYNVLGSVVQRRMFEVKSNYIEIPLVDPLYRKISNGVYFVMINFDSQKIIEKIVISK